MFNSTDCECERGKRLSSKKAALREDSFYSFVAKSLLYMIALCQEVLLYVREILRAEEVKENPK